VLLSTFLPVIDFSCFTPPALMPQLTHSALRLRRLGYVGLKQMVRFGYFASEVFRYGKNQKCNARKQCSERPNDE
jgi:hypothetical protein